jgi:AcrR family transcriptional regulator
MATATPAERAPTQRAPFATAVRELLRSTLLDAAVEQMGQRGWAQITMADVAQTAGVSRQTLYKEFGSREEFAQALVMREVSRFLVSVEEAVSAHLDDASSALSAAFSVFLTAAAENPLVRAIVHGEGAEELITLFTTRGVSLVESASEHLTEVMLAGWPQVERADAELLSEGLVRLAISYAAVPGSPAPQETAAAVTRLFGPFVERALGG